MRELICAFLCLIVLTGCTTVSELEHVKRGEGQEILYDESFEKMVELSQKALENCGLVVERVNRNRQERIEVLGYQPASLGETGSVYGIYVYPLGASQCEIYLVRKRRYPSDVFASDAREAILAKLDELVLADRR
ncbi:MAG: hypothetical protein HYS08_09965 [Chlamydiae bacterium]|nr:hypothetical protein [Chlamydiota bacterium]MBI3267026.1 hypothetical protein [Chlamydiota bacterium]